MESAPSNITLEKATKKDIKDIVELLYMTEPEPQTEWGMGTEKEQKGRLKKMMRKPKNRFSLENILAVKKKEKLVGMVLLIEGKEIDKLTINSEKEVFADQKGISDKLKYIYLSVKDYLLCEECKEDEFYLSNIAIKPDYRGKGYASIVIDKVYQIAKKKGYQKVSLIAKNEQLISFYQKLGFKLIDKKGKRMLSCL